MVSIIIRNAAERDYPSVARIQERAPEAAQWPLGDYAGHSVLLAVVEGIPAGFLCWRQVAPDEAELLNLAVDPSFRRRGVAQALLARLDEAAKGTIFLEAAADNEPALALYAKAGWERVAIRRGYYRQGSIDGVVMKKRSCYSPV